MNPSSSLPSGKAEWSQLEFAPVASFPTNNIVNNSTMLTADTAPEPVSSRTRTFDADLERTASSYSGASHRKLPREKLPFFGPPDPEHSPPEKWMFLAGFIFFPCWVLGGFRKWRDHDDSLAELFRWRCQVMLMMFTVIMIGLICVELVFRGK